MGYELRWVGRIGSAFSAMDFDLYYRKLNLIMASGSVELTEGTSLNLSADYRRAPYLTTRNALIGQGLPSINALRLRFTDDQIEQLAQDRTSTSTTVTVGLDQRLGTRWTIAGDFTATTLDGGAATTLVFAVTTTDATVSGPIDIV